MEWLIERRSSFSRPRTLFFFHQKVRKTDVCSHKKVHKAFGELKEEWDEQSKRMDELKPFFFSVTGACLGRCHIFWSYLNDFLGVGV